MLRTEADVLRTLRCGVYTLEELYRRCEAHADVARDGGLEPPDASHPTDRRWRHRLRGALQNQRAAGTARHVGRTIWALNGTRERPGRLALVVAGTTVEEFEFRLLDAVELLSSLDEPADLVLCDPPYGLDRGTPRSSAERNYLRDCQAVIPGYRDVPPAQYEAFTRRWIAAAAEALRPSGQLAVVTGPQQAAVVQYTAQQAGLEFVSSVAAFRHFALRTTRRPAFSHWTVTVMCRGRVDDRRRVFNCPPDLPKARSGIDYPLDWWPDNGRADRHGLVRYDNSLPQRLVDRIVAAFSNAGDLVVDPCLGGGTTAIACWRLQRRLIAGDLNPDALRYSAARLLDEHIWPAAEMPPLFTRLVA